MMVSNTFLVLAQFYGIILVTGWSIWQAGQKIRQIMFESLRHKHEARMAEIKKEADIKISDINKEIEVAKAKQTSIQEVASILQLVHLMDKRVGDLERSVEDIQESEEEHKTHVKENIHDIRQSVEKIKDNLLIMFAPGLKTPPH